MDSLIDDGQVQEFIRARAKAVDELRKLRSQIGAEEQRSQVNQLEINDLQRFLEFLEELSQKLPRAQASSDIIGNIDFTHCPACLTALSDDKGVGHCVVCGAPTNPERERSRLLQIKTDLDIQIRESRQLLEDKQRASMQIDRDLRVVRREYQDKLSEYTVKFDLSTSPRESFVAQRHQRIGQIDRESAALVRLRERVLEIEKLSAEKAELQEQISKLKDRHGALQLAGRNRRSQALSLVSRIARDVLRQDLERQAEFRTGRECIAELRR